MYKYLIACLFFIACSEVSNTSIKESEIQHSEKISDSSKLVHSLDTIISLKTPDSTKSLVVNDTIFLHRKRNEYFYHAIYIETNRTSKYYDWLTDFSIEEDEERIYNSSLSDKKHDLKHIQIDSLPVNWLPVYQHDDNFYLYAPSDWGATGRKAINDSTYITWYMDGPFPQPIETLRATEKNKTELVSYNSIDEIRDTIYLYKLNTSPQVYLWEFIRNDRPNIYSFFTSSELAKEFDIIVNYCDTEKQDEYEFDKIDFETITKKYR